MAPSTKDLCKAIIRHDTDAVVTQIVTMQHLYAEDIPMNEMYTLMCVLKNQYMSYTPLMWCAKTGYLELLKFLLDNGAEETINLVSGDGCNDTALTLAATFGHDDTRGDMVDLLLDAGAELEQRVRYNGVRGCTALMIATHRNKIDTMERLLRRGANVQITDSKGRKAYDFAKVSGIFNINRSRKLLMDYGALL